jgi:hypothetical protein
LATDPAFFANGMAWLAAGCSRAAAWRARRHAPSTATPVRWCALLRDIETSAAVCLVAVQTSQNGPLQPFQRVISNGPALPLRSVAS